MAGKVFFFVAKSFGLVSGEENTTNTTNAREGQQGSKSSKEEEED